MNKIIALSVSLHLPYMVKHKVLLDKWRSRSWTLFLVIGSWSKSYRLSQAIMHGWLIYIPFFSSHTGSGGGLSRRCFTTWKVSFPFYEGTKNKRNTFLPFKTQTLQRKCCFTPWTSADYWVNPLRHYSYFFCGIWTFLWASLVRKDTKYLCSIFKGVPRFLKPPVIFLCLSFFPVSLLSFICGPFIVPLQVVGTPSQP